MNDAASLLRAWTKGGFYYSDEWERAFRRFRRHLVPDDFPATARLYRSEYPNDHEQYSRCTSWTRYPCVAATYGGPERRAVSAVIRSDQIAAVIPAGVFETDQGEVVVFPWRQECSGMWTDRGALDAAVWALPALSCSSVATP